MTGMLHVIWNSFFLVFISLYFAVAFDSVDLLSLKLSPFLAFKMTQSPSFPSTSFSLSQYSLFAPHSWFNIQTLEFLSIQSYVLSFLSNALLCDPIYSHGKAIIYIFLSFISFLTDIIIIFIYGVQCVFLYIYTLYNYIRVISISITLNICHFFAIRTFKNLSYSYFDIYNTLLLTLFMLLCNRTPEHIPAI